MAMCQKENPNGEKTDFGHLSYKTGFFLGINVFFFFFFFSIHRHDSHDILIYTMFFEESSSIRA